MAVGIYCSQCKLPRDSIPTNQTPNEDGSYTDPCPKCGCYSVGLQHVEKEAKNEFS